MAKGQGENGVLSKLPYLGVGFVLGIACVSLWFYARGNESRLCDLCHEMAEAHTSFRASVHGRGDKGIVPSCSDCHEFTPYRAGLNLWAHLTRTRPPGSEDRAKRVVPDRACLACHRDLLAENMTPRARVEHFTYQKQRVKTCLDCHDEEGLFHRDEPDQRAGDGPF